MHPVLAYIGIGSNLNNPLSQVQQAFQDLDGIASSRCVARSPCYRSEPLGPEGQPDYVNAAAALQTSLPPMLLLQALQSIEASHGRVRTLRWGPRTLDLDILLYGDLIQSDPYLTIPHPRLHERAFVLYPLRDIAPYLVIPNLGAVQMLIRQCPPLDLQRLEQLS